MGKSKLDVPWCASMFAQIKPAIDLPHAEALHVLQEIVSQLEDHHVQKEELCRSTGSYHHNRHLWNVLFLRLGECLDSDICPDQADDRMAAKYYQLSDQPPARWRYARLCLSGRFKPSIMQQTPAQMIKEAIHDLIREDQGFAPQYFGIRLKYLSEMLEDVVVLEQSDLYFDVLRWVVLHKDLVRVDHEDALIRLLDMSIDGNHPSDDAVLEEFTALVS